jgi:hypothetical protein
MRFILVVSVAVLGTAFAGALGVACSSPAKENSSSGTGALVVDGGTNETASQVTLQLPADACAPGAVCAKVLGTAPVLSIDGAGVALGTATTLVPGAHAIVVNNQGWSVTTNPGDDLTFVLPIADTVCQPDLLPAVPPTDFGGSVTVSNAPCPMTATESAISTGAPPVTVPLTSAFEAYAPGTLTTSVNGSTESFTLNLGDEVDLDLSLPVLGSVPATFSTTLTSLDPRANPDAAQGTITSSCSGDRSYVIPSAAGTPAPIDLAAFVNSDCIYTLSVGGRPQVLSQTTPNAFTLRRVDVNDVSITEEDEDGGTYTVKGEWTLSYRGTQVAGPYTTGTGIDVFPGTYEFSLTYTDFDGPQTQTQTITL